MDFLSSEHAKASLIDHRKTMDERRAMHPVLRQSPAGGSNARSHQHRRRLDWPIYMQILVLNAMQ